MATVTANSVESTSKNSAISTEDDLYLVRTIAPLLVICACLLINYAFTYAAILIKGGKDFHTSYYTLSKGLVWSDLAVLTTTACYFAARLYKDPSGRDRTLRYAWVFNGACAYFPGLIINWFLTWNRFTAIVFFSRYKIWFTIRRARFMVASAFLFALSEAFWISLMPYWLQHYFYMIMPGLTIAMFLCAYPVCIVVSVIRIKSNMAAHDRKKFLVEIKLLVQAVLVGCMLFLQEFLYQATAGGLIYEIFYMLYGGLNPFIYLSLDVKIRRVYFKLLCFKYADNLIAPTSKTAPQISVVAAAKDGRK